MAINTGTDLDDYWPTLEIALPSQIFSALKEKICGDGSEVGHSSSHTNPQAQRRLLADDQDGGLPPKRIRYIQTDLGDGGPDNHDPCSSQRDGVAELQSLVQRD